MSDSENSLEMLKAAAEQFEDENEDLEVVLSGDIGFHTFFVAEGDDVTRGVHTAIYQGLYELLQEVSVDADIVEHHHGEVTPETVWQETRVQLEEFTYLPSTMLDPIEAVVKNRVRENMKNHPGDCAQLGDFE